MSVAVVGTPQKKAWDDTTSTTTLAIDCTGATGLLVAVGYRDPTPNITLSAFTYNSVAMTRQGSVFTSNTGIGNPGQRIDFFYLVNPASGSHNFSVTASATMGNGTGAVIMAWAVSGNDTTTMMGTAGGGGDVTQDVVTPFTTMSATTTTVSGDMVFDLGLIASTSPSAFTANAGQTSSPGTQTTADNVSYGGGSYKAATTTSTSTGWIYAPSLSYNAIYRAVVVKAGAAATTSSVPIKPGRIFLPLYSC